MPEPIADPDHAGAAPGVTGWDDLLAATRRGSVGDRPPEHRPSIAVLACSDARVPPSVIFDQPAGQLFVVRIAGNTASPSALASLDFAVGQLGVELLVVLGHTDCGAVAAAAAGTCDGHLAPVVRPICELATEHPDLTPAELVPLNVATTVAALTAHAGPTGEAARSAQLTIRGAVYDLVSGRLQEVDPTSDPGVRI